MINILRRIKQKLLSTPPVSVDMTPSMILQGQMLTHQIESKGLLPSIQDAEFKVFSQFGEDGILQYLIREANLPRSLHTFIEFGVQNYEEANTRFLLMNNNWRGLILDGSESGIRHVTQSPWFWRYDLTATCAFLTKENINHLFTDAGFEGEIGLLSIDLDGNDYWIWDSIASVNPVLVVAEYNSVFGSSRAVSVPYDESFVRSTAHHSNLYWGCSLKALNCVAHKKGYKFVGCNRAGNNAFFVRNDYMNRLQPLSIEEGFVESRFRESRNREGDLNYLTGARRLTEIGDLPLIDVETNQSLSCSDI